MLKLFALFVVIFFKLKTTDACNGYQLKMNYVRNCYDTSVVKIQKDFDVQMDKDCNLIVSGCLDFTKPIKTSKGTYMVKKPPMPNLTGKLDLCEAMESPQFPQIGNSFGIPAKCPFPMKKACGLPDKKISIAALKNQMSLAAGTTQVKLDLNHDSGRTCAEFSFTISRKK